MRIKKEHNIQIGERVKAARESARLTQEQFAERIDVSPQYVSDLERGVVGVSIPTLKRICICLCISSDQLLFDQRSDTGYHMIAEKCRRLTREQFRILCQIIDSYLEALDTARKQP